MKDLKQEHERSDVHVVVGIIRRGDKILVCERPAGKPYSGYWEFPGGKINHNESNLQALQRELHEELGIEVTHAKQWLQHYHAYPDKTILLDIWAIESFSGEPCGMEQQVLRWATLQEITELEILDGNGPIIDKLTTLA